MENFIQKGDVIKITASATATSGVPVVCGDRAVIACHDASSGEALETLWEGVVKLAKTTVAMSVGDKLYWDASDANVQKDSDTGTNKAIGWAASGVASGAAYTLVKLGGF